MIPVVHPSLRGVWYEYKAGERIWLGDTVMVQEDRAFRATSLIKATHVAMTACVEGEIVALWKFGDPQPIWGS